MKKFTLILALLLSMAACHGQPKRVAVDYVTTPEDRALAEKVLADLKAHPGEEPGAQMVRAAKDLLGQPYVAGTLEELPEEKLCIYLTRTDCILFVETCLGLVRAARQGEKRGTVENVSGALGVVALDHPVHEMSMHPDAYARMHDIAAIAAIEDRINAEPSTYIPKSALKKALGGIRSGDILFFNTRVDGLDISHCGIALAEPGKPVTFIHASTVPMKVVVEQKSLEEYVMGKKATTGIEVYRVR